MMKHPVDTVNQTADGRSDDVLELVHAVMHLYRSRQFKVLRDAEQGITHMDSKVLGFFARHPLTTQRDLVAHSGRDKGQVARLITGLRDRGLLEAQPDEADKRSVRLQLSAAGKSIHQALRRQARNLSLTAVNGLDEGERGQLIALLGRLRANLESEQLPD